MSDQFSATKTIPPYPLRQRRAQFLTAMIMDIVAPFLQEDRRRDCIRAVHNGLQDAFHSAGVEIITDEDRRSAGLPPRDHNGWTAEELRIRENKLLMAMLQPMPPLLVRRTEK